MSGKSEDSNSASVFIRRLIAGAGSGAITKTSIAPIERVQILHQVIQQVNIVDVGVLIFMKTRRRKIVRLLKRRQRKLRWHLCFEFLFLFLSHILVSFIYWRNLFSFSLDISLDGGQQCSVLIPTPSYPTKHHVYNGYITPQTYTHNPNADTRNEVPEARNRSSLRRLFPNGSTRCQGKSNNQTMTTRSVRIICTPRIQCSGRQS